ncbi:MAG TPA: acetyl-CoA carboxylase carboxyltransferase subunit alpha/beta [Chloroflexota bacterium]|nr:acetyl-CoA carboxylase carboxyltransferase subunit alpha/beta [Chloroflexota bacterium]
MRNIADLFGDRRTRRPPALPEPAPLAACPRCGEALAGAELYDRLRVCPHCRRHFTLGARERIAALADPGSFRETHPEMISVDPLEFRDRLPYRDRLLDAQSRTGLSEAAVTGTLRIGGRPAVVAVLDFEFLGGSMGSVVGEKVALAFELAVKHHLPMITIVGSGGARMQEGILSLMQMAKTAAAVARLHAARLPYVSVLTHPTTGGVFASFASLGDVTLAEPGALIGFAGPRVLEQTGVARKDDAARAGRDGADTPLAAEAAPAAPPPAEAPAQGSAPPPPVVQARLETPPPPAASTPPPAPPAERSHSAEFLLAHGMLDAVVDRTRLREVLASLLGYLSPEYRLSRGREHEIVSAGWRGSAWDTVQLARHAARPTALDYIHRLMPDFLELHGDRLFGDDPAVIIGLGDLAGIPVAVIGQERDPDDPERHGGRARPEGYRKADRMMRLAAKFHLPLLTFIDTPGAEAGVESEARGLASAMATCLARMSRLPVPTVAAVIGEGGSGGALAFGVADRVLMQEHAIYSVISPEGASAILFRDAALAPDLAPSLRLTAPDLRELGVIDAIVPEPTGGAHLDPDAAARYLKDAILHELIGLQEVPPARLVRQRYARYRGIGAYTSRRRAAFARHLTQVQDHLQRTVDLLRERLPHGRAPAAPPEPEAQS